MFPSNKLTPSEIELKNNLVKQVISSGLDDVKPIKISVEQMTEFRNAITQVLIEEKVPAIKHDRIIDAYVKTIDFYQYMSEANTRKLLTNLDEAKQNKLFVENQKLPAEIDRLFNQVGYPQQGAAHQKINDRVLNIPVFKDVLANFAKVIAKEAVEKANEPSPMRFGRG